MSMESVRKLSGRGIDPVLTEFVCTRILTEVALEPNDRVVDIGCGDGTLLRLAVKAGAASAIGLTGTQEEAETLLRLGLNVKHGRTEQLPLPDQSASVVICNSVLHIVPAEQIPASLREIARIAEPGARIWIGEIPRFREPASIRTFPNIPAMLWWLLRKRGLRTFLGMCRRLVTGEQRGATLRTSQSFWAEPESFSRMAADAGLTVQRNFPNRLLDKAHQPMTSPTRHDYVLVRERKSAELDTSATSRRLA